MKLMERGTDICPSCPVQNFSGEETNGLFEGPPFQNRSDMAQTGAEGKRVTMRIVILKSMHESKEELTINVHGTTDIADQDQFEGFRLPLLHLQLHDFPSVFDRSPDGSSEVEAIPLSALFPSSR